jgi:hypothetical protein
MVKSTSTARSLLQPLFALESVERGTWTILVGLVFLAAGISYHWLLVPSNALSSFEAGVLNIAVIEPEEAVLLRVVVLIASSFLLFGLLRGERHRFAMRAGVWAVLLAALSFPSAIMLWEPRIALDAATTWNELENVIVVEIDSSYDEQQTAWRRDQKLVPLNTKQLARLSRPLSDLFPSAPGGGGGIAPSGTLGRAGSLFSDGVDVTMFRFARIQDVAAHIFGYSNAFLNLARRGWYATLIGSIIVIIGLYLPLHRGGRSFTRDMRVVLPCCALLLAMLLAPRAIADRLIAEGELAQARGDNPAAEANFRAAAAWKPILNYTVAFHAKLGEFSLARNCFDCAESLLNLAEKAVHAHRFSEAIDFLERCRSLHPTCPHIDDWLGFVYAQRAVDLYNTGQDSAAAADWWKALSYVPLGAKSVYGLVLTQFHLRDFDAAAQSMKQIVEIQKLFFWKRPPPTSQWHVAEAWAAFQRGDIAQAHAFYSLALTPENW